MQNVLPSMEAAFVDIGRGRNAVLYAGEVDWDAAGLGGKARRIEQALHSGDSVLVQVTKDPIGHKGARLTTQISLAGRFLVYVPSGGAAGISRKLPDIERKRLKDMLKEIVPSEAGVIIRTASEGVSQEALERDVRRLQAQWEVVKTKSEQTGPNKPKAPALLYEEPDLLIKVVRDQFNEDFSRLVVEGDDAWDTLQNYVGARRPGAGRPAAPARRRPTDVFAAYRIDEQLLKALDRKVWLPSGGTLVIDRTEAMTVIDVNTGKFTGSGGNLEETVTRNNLEAAEEIVRQLRLRDIGGIIVIDFIDMVLEANRDLVLRRLTECLARDRTRHQVAEVTSLGLVQMTRKRVGGGPAGALLHPVRALPGPRRDRQRGAARRAEPEPVGGAAPTGERRAGRRVARPWPARRRRGAPARRASPSRRRNGSTRNGSPMDVASRDRRWTRPSRPVERPDAGAGGRRRRRARTRGPVDRRPRLDGRCRRWSAETVDRPPRSRCRTSRPGRAGRGRWPTSRRTRSRRSWSSGRWPSSRPARPTRERGAAGRAADASSRSTPAGGRGAATASSPTPAARRGRVTRTAGAPDGRPAATPRWPRRHGARPPAATGPDAESPTPRRSRCRARSRPQPAPSRGHPAAAQPAGRPPDRPDRRPPRRRLGARGGDPV